MVDDFDFFDGLLRAQLIFADDRSHGLSDKASFADGQQRMIFYGVSVIGMKPAEIVPREHADDPRLVDGLRGIDGKDLGVRKRAAEELGPGHAFHGHVTRVGGASGHLGQAIAARN